MTDMDIDIDLEMGDDSDIGLGEEDKNKVGNQIDWYKGEKGRTDRVALLYFNNIKQTTLRKALKAKPDITKEQQKSVLIQTLQKLAEKLGKSIDQLDDVDMLDLNEARFKTVSASFKQGIGYVEWPKKLTSEEEKVWKKLGDKRSYVFTVLMQYPTDREGEIDKDRLSKNWRVLPWRFSSDKYDVLRKINKGLGESGAMISGIDLNFACTDATYQKITITQAGPSLYQKSDKFRRLVLEKALPLYEKLGLRQLTTDELREKLGMGAGSSGGGSSGGGYDAGEDFSSIIQNI